MRSNAWGFMLQKFEMCPDWGANAWGARKAVFPTPVQLTASASTLDARAAILVNDPSGIGT
jgi:hypothetical protein